MSTSTPSPPTPPPPRRPAPTRPARSTGRRVLAVTAVVLGLLLLVAGLDRATRDTATTSETFDAAGVRSLVVGTSAGEVTVVATDRADITVEARATSGLFSDADVAIDATATGWGWSATATGSTWGRAASRSPSRSPVTCAVVSPSTPPRGGSRCVA